MLAYLLKWSLNVNCENIWVNAFICETLYEYNYFKKGNFIRKVLFFQNNYGIGALVTRMVHYKAEPHKSVIFVES